MPGQNLDIDHRREEQAQRQYLTVLPPAPAMQEWTTLHRDGGVVVVNNFTAATLLDRELAMTERGINPDLAHWAAGYWDRDKGQPVVCGLDASLKKQLTQRLRAEHR